MGIVEVLKGIFKMHVFYVSKLRHSLADINDSSNTLYLYGNPYGIGSVVSNVKNHIWRDNRSFFRARFYETYESQSSLSFDIKRNRAISRLSLNQFGWELNKFNAFLVDKLVYYNKSISLSQLYSSYSTWSNTSITSDGVFKLVTNFYKHVKDTGMFLLRKNHIGTFPKTLPNRFFVSVDY